MGVSLDLSKLVHDPKLTSSSQTYDTDNNFLQTVDDAQISAVIPGLLESRPKDSASPLSILDFGCGTGRTTLKLLRACPTDTQISAWDGSAEMIALAQRKCSSLEKSTLASVDFQQVDFSILQKLPSSQAFDILVSTLVLEHISSEVFFTWIFRLLKPGGIAFVSNMHPDMGQNSVAGFDDENQRRIKGRSYLHTVEESVDAARQAGLEVFENDLKVASVTAAMIDSGLVSERGRKWIGKRVLFGFAARRPSNKPESS